MRVVIPEEFHIIHIAENMRESDVREVWAAGHYTPEEALRYSSSKSIDNFTFLVNEEPIAMFGVAVSSFMSTEGCPWLMGRKELDKHVITIGVFSKRYIEYFMKRYELLENYVDTRNEKNIKWLKWLGFELDPPVPYGPDDQLFHRFYMRRFE